LKKLQNAEGKKYPLVITLADLAGHRELTAAVLADAFIIAALAAARSFVVAQLLMRSQALVNVSGLSPSKGDLVLILL
jgi:hypothetical protein